MSLNHWTRVLGEGNSRYAPDFQRLDVVMEEFVMQEDITPMLYDLLPGGRYEQTRKQLSYDGAIQDTTDPGNYTYGTFMKLYSMSIDATDRRYVIKTSGWNDGTLGDVLEAIMGLGYRRRNGGDTMGAFDLIGNDELAEYIGKLEQALLQTHRCLEHMTSMGMWYPSSGGAATFLS